MKPIIRSLNPLSKIAIWAAFILAAMICSPGWQLGVCVAAVILIITLPTNSYRTLVSFATRVIVPTVVMLFVIYGLLVPEPPGIGRVEVACIGVSLWGVQITMVIAARLFVISASTIGFTAAVPLMELAGGLRTLGMPVSIAAVFISSFNIYFLTKQKTRQIIDAQRSRGLRPKGLILGRARMYIPILRPLLFGMLLAAVERSSLWQSRGYLSFIGHQSLGIRQRDCIAMFMALMVVLAAVLSRWIV